MRDLDEVLSAPTISIRKAAEVLGISLKTAYAAADRGEIPTISVGRLRPVPTALFKRLLGLADAPTK